MIEHLVDGAVAEDRHPREGETERNQQHAKDEFANGPATGNPRDEQAHERRPRNPPSPIEHRPAAQPVARFVVGVEVETLHRQGAEVVAEVLDQGVEQVLRGAGEQHEQQQRAGQQHVDVGHHSHAFVDTGHRDDDRRAHHQRDQADLNPMGVSDAEQVVQARVEVQHAETHVGA
ncbi:hypothetical protein D3C72_1381980 [compost metagenome]